MLSHIFINYRLSTLKKTTVLFVHQYGTDTPLGSYTNGLLRAVQRWITNRRLSMKTRCYLTLQTVEPIALPLTKCLGVFTNIPVFAFFPCTVSLSRTMLAMFDWLSYNWLLAKLLSPRNDINYSRRTCLNM